MMGPTHAASGLAAGAVAATAIGITEPAAIAAVSTITAGAALLPDLDHPSATLARTFGPVSKAASVATNKFSSMVATAISTKSDRGSDGVVGGHRTLTHTVFGVAAGAAWGWFAGLWETWGVLLLVFVMVSLAMAGVITSQTRKWGAMGSLLVAAAVTAAIAYAAPETLTPAMLALFMGLGVLTHIAGDGVTVQGIPFLAPLKIGGKRWKRVHIVPSFLRFTAGQWPDKVLFAVFTAIAGFVLWESVAPGTAAGIADLTTALI